MDDHTAPDQPNEFEPASAHLEAELVTRPGTPTARTMRALANIAVGMLTGEGDAGVSTVDLVVSRKLTGGEILRVTAGSIVDADQLLQRVRRDLDEKSVTDFLAEWRLSTEPGE